jgi:hypothetical protein
LGKLAMATLPQSLGGRLLVLQLAFPLWSTIEALFCQPQN